MKEARIGGSEVSQLRVLAKGRNEGRTDGWEETRKQGSKEARKQG